ncbi:2-C-methyl-D-erythritol 4-phosphate cytidylyltransferase [Ramlibacter sp.]|uniref:IspD/TarI family cytidylyltransferase n=1 Tax=Ramlibacter sp. TaxID=1917967 RepID=UPI0035B47417
MAEDPGPVAEDVSVLIPAAGLGERLGLGPKALLPLAGRPVIDWLVEKARPLGAEVLVGCAPGMAAPPASTRVEGGTTRQATLTQLVAAATRPWVLLWDACSPFASVALARRVLGAAQATGAATACLRAPVRWLRVEGDRVTEALPGTEAGQSQTPQAFRADLLRELCAQAAREGWQPQSANEMVLRAGLPLAWVEGEALNIKLTTADDWVLAQALTHRLRA